MMFPFLLFLICSLAALGTLQLMGRPAAAADDTRVAAPYRSIWSITLSTPALLVPTLLSGLVAWLALLGAWRPEQITGNPFTGCSDHASMDSMPSMASMASMASVASMANIALLVAMAILVAGYVGLLQAWYSGLEADGSHFWEGIKDHAFTFLLAKLAVAAFVGAAAARLPLKSPVTAFVYLAPSLLLAPLLGTAALHPRRPFHALRAAVQRTWDMAATSRLLFMQIMVMLGLWVAYHGQGGATFSTHPGLGSVEVLARDASTLSFNPFPLMSATFSGSGDGDFWIGLLCTVIGMFFSTVFMHLHFRRVLTRPHP
jgi:hypothetical protein